MGSVLFEVSHECIAVITINRPEARNAVDGNTARSLYDAFSRFEKDTSLYVAILTGCEGNFCSGADLKTLSNPLELDGIAPMGISRMLLSKPVIAAIEGFCVAGGLELACWCDLRVCSEEAVFGVFCRRWGVPLIDGGTIR